VIPEHSDREGKGRREAEKQVSLLGSTFNEQKRGRSAGQRKSIYEEDKRNFAVDI
jgi:hypothetical protein